MEELRLYQGKGLAIVKILSPKLKRAEFVDCQGLKMIEIKSLTLESFKKIQKKNQECSINISEGKSLKNLVLEGLSVTDKWLWDNLSEFHALESLQLSDCRLLTYMHVLNDGIKLVKVKRCPILERVVINALNLEAFEYEGDTKKQCEISILHCKFLKNLVLVGASITNTWLRDHMDQLALLESLKLQCCNFLEKVKISDHKSLCNLYLENCTSLVEFECGVENLGLFAYVGGLMVSPPLILASDLHAQLSLNSPLLYPLPDNWFKELRDFLAFFSHCKKLTLLVNQALLFPEEVRREMLLPLYDITDLELDLGSKEMSIVDLVDSALWLAPHPEIVTLDFKSYGKILIKLAYGETDTIVKRRRGRDSGCCRYRRPIKCWRHKLTKVAIENLKQADNDATVCKRLIRYLFDNARMLKQVLVDGDIFLPNKPKNWESSF